MIVSGQVFDLFDFQPFHEDTKIALLEEALTLKIDADLPIIDGATSLYPLYSAFVRATYPEMKIIRQVPGTCRTITPYQIYRLLDEGKSSTSILSRTRFHQKL